MNPCSMPACLSNAVYEVGLVRNGVSRLACAAHVIQVLERVEEIEVRWEFARNAD